MANYAIISVNGTQEIVRVGDVIRMRGEMAGETFDFNEVHFVGGEKVMIGAPLVKGAVVTAKVGDTFRGEKIRVSTFKAKSNRHKVRGYRDLYTQLTITGIKTA